MIGKVEGNKSKEGKGTDEKRSGTAKTQKQENPFSLYSGWERKGD